MHSMHSDVHCNNGADDEGLHKTTRNGTHNVSRHDIAWRASSYLLTPAPQWRYPALQSTAL